MQNVRLVVKQIKEVYDTPAAEVIKDLMANTVKIDPSRVDDVIMGCTFLEASQGLNMARNIALHAYLPNSVSGMTVNRFCSSGLQIIALATERVVVGAVDIIVAVGVESMSMIPLGGMSLQPNPELMDTSPKIYISMGLTAENIAAKYKISR